jgi:hypothetical protein
MVLSHSVFFVLGAAAPARAVAHNSHSRLSKNGSTVLLSGLWRPALTLEFTHLVHKSLLALVPLFMHMCLSTHTLYRYMGHYRCMPALPI